MAKWSSLDEEKRLCNQWLRDQLVNPETGRAIERDGPKFNEWKSRCKKVGLSIKPQNTGEMTWRKCDAWKKNPGINPETGRKIKIGGPKYKKLEKQCAGVVEKKPGIEGEYYAPDRNGMVPCVKSRDGQFFAIRTLSGRRVWGPINRPVGHVVLGFYTRTWDYKKGYYRPVYLGSRPTPPPMRQQRSQNSARRSDSPKYMVDKFLGLFF